MASNTNNKHLVFAILNFLDQQLQSSDLNADEKESLEVATQCLESAYKVSLHESGASSLYPLPAPLPQLFSVGLAHSGVANASVADKESAEKFKCSGNELLKQEKYQEAIDAYTQAIALDGSNAVYYCNRAAAFGKLGDHHKSLNDCEKAIMLDPKYSKAYGRKGLAHSAVKQHKEARDCYKKALELDPINDGYRENLRLSEDSLQQQPVGGAGAAGGAEFGSLGGLDFTSLLNNPALMNMATSMLSNPQMQSMMANMMSGGANPSTGGGGGAPTSMSGLLQAGQQLAQQMQAANPELVEQLRSQMRSQTPPGSNPNQSS